MEKIYNVVDKFTDHVGSIIIEDIGYCFCEYTCCVYYGTKLNKDDVPTHEIEQDIIETQEEIDQYQKELDALMVDVENNLLDIYMQEDKILIRKRFINCMNSILEYRKSIV